MHYVEKNVIVRHMVLLEQNALSRALEEQRGILLFPTNFPQG